MEDVSEALSGAKPRRFAVETWAPEYGGSIEDAGPVASTEPVDAQVEIAASDWAPRTPTVPPVSAVSFVDGVRRIEARVWITAPSGAVHQGICASYAAGVVSCDGAATIQIAEVRRGLFARTDGAGALETRHGMFAHMPVAADSPDQLSVALQNAMADLENEVSQAAPPGLLVVDGPLRERHRIPEAVGYVKTHQRAYLSNELAGVVAALDSGQRTPLFLIDGRARRWSWYLRLPGTRAHPWSGIVRCETSADLPLADAAGRADEVTATLGRFASASHKDGRAPQNLYPIGGLERVLRRRLGDTHVLQRALRQAAAATAA